MCLVLRSVLRIALPMLLLQLPLAPYGVAKCAGTVASLRHRSDKATTVAVHVSAGKSRRAVVISKLSKWPGSILPYTISDTLGEPGKAVVAAAIDAYTKQSCVQIRPWAGERDYVTFTRGKSCSSQIGRSGLQQFIYIGSDCEVAGKVMHEIYHTLGRWHEHCRPDRDQYVQINRENIISGKLLEFALVNPLYTAVQGLPYDYDSIMHYEAAAFSVNAQPTIKPLNLSVSLDRLGQREKFSPLDLQHLAILYCNGWGQWTPWGECSVDCGQGVRRRSRVCTSKALCGEDETQEEPCNLEPCSGTPAVTTTSVPSATSAVVPALVSTSVPPSFIQRTTSVMPVVYLTVQPEPTEHKTTSRTIATTITAKTTASQPASDPRPTPTPVAGTPHVADGSLWSLCSRPCGGGTQFKTVAAPQGTEHRPCNIQPCIPVVCEKNAQQCSIGWCLLGLRNQDCLSHGTGSPAMATHNKTLTLHPLNTKSQGGSSSLLQCVRLAIATGHSRFAVITEQCYLGDGSLLAEAPVVNCTEPCTVQGRLVGCFYEITDSILLKQTAENITACQANSFYDSSVCSGVSRQHTHYTHNVVIVTFFLLSRLL